MTVACPKGHTSEDSDFCSVCGVKIAAVPPAEPAGPLTTCPDCNAPRHSEDAVFCEDCGFNFTSGAHGEPKAPPPVVTEWEVAVSIDPSLKTPESPDPPADFHPSP